MSFFDGMNVIMSNESCDLVCSSLDLITESFLKADVSKPKTICFLPFSVITPALGLCS